MAVNYSALAAKLLGTVLVSGTDEYENALKHWAANVNRNAAAIAQVISAEDVSDAALLLLPVKPNLSRFDSRRRMELILR